MKLIIALLFISHAIANVTGDDYAKIIIEKTEAKYRLVNDYEVRIDNFYEDSSISNAKKKIYSFF